MISLGTQLLLENIAISYVLARFVASTGFEICALSL